MAITVNDIKAKLSELEIEFDATAKKAELLELLNPETIAEMEATPKVDLIPCVVLRDFWDEKAVRTRKGKIIEVTAEEAMDGMENGTLERVKKAD